MLGVEPAILPKRRAKKPVKDSAAEKTQRMRRDFNEADVCLLQWILKAPSPFVAIAEYRARHQRVLKPKRTQSDPDVPHPNWRSRPERHLTARQLMEQQLSGKALLKELKRLR